MTERIIGTNKKVQYVKSFSKECPKCGEKVIISKYDNGIEIYCKNYCSIKHEHLICDPEIKCPDCEYLERCGGCKIPIGKACSFEDWLEYENR